MFANRRLAEIYDALDPRRDDLDVYAALVDELGARSVLDVGCGTGTFACMLALRGIDVVGVDPARASLDVARRKLGADRVRWIEGDATGLPPLQVELVTMTGNVAQVFVGDDDWEETLRGVHGALAPGGRLVFETRDPAQQAWHAWNADASRQRTLIPGVGAVVSWVETTSVRGSAVTIRWTFEFEADRAMLTSDSTLRFRSQRDIDASLAATGFVTEQVRDAPDRPGAELVFIVRRESLPRVNNAS